MTYQETIEFLFSQLPMFQKVGASAYKKDLGNISKMLDIIGNPERNLKCIHIAGTNGKGSTSHMIASILQEEGYNVGLYTSPHLKDFRERVKVNGQMINEQEVIDFVRLFSSHFDTINPSFFEWTVAFAFYSFDIHKVDYAVIETGLGGRLDSTNIIVPIISVITNIGLDHISMLGDTISQIAFEKAGIIKSSIPVVIGEYNEESRPVFEKRALEMNAPIYFASDDLHVQHQGLIPFSNKLYQEIFISTMSQSHPKEYLLELLGIYQSKNLITVLKTIEILKSNHVQISEQSVVRGLKNTITNTSLLGRWQLLSTNPTTIADVGHNEAGMNENVAQIKSYKANHVRMVIGFSGDKSIDEILYLLPKNATYYFCSADSQRALSADVLKEKAHRIGLKGKDYNSVNEAYLAAKDESSPDDLIYIGGSVFVVAEVL